MWARVARFEGDPADIDTRIEKLRAMVDGVTLFESEAAMRRGDEAMNAGPGNAGSRASVEFYEVPLDTL